MNADDDDEVELTESFMIIALYVCRVGYLAYFWEEGVVKFASVQALCKRVT